MKRMLTYIALLIVAVPCCYSQDKTEVILTREGAVEILQESNLVNIRRFSDNPMISVELFVREIEKILSVDLQKREGLKEQIIDVISREQGPHCALICWPLDNPPLIGTEVKSIMRNNFNLEEYSVLKEQLENKAKQARDAYDYLRKLWKKEREEETGDIVVFSYDSIEQADMIYDYFGI